MPAVVVTKATFESDPEGDVVRLEYLHPGGLLDADKPGYGGHEHIIPVVAVWVRMVQYGISKEEALEEIVAERVAPDILNKWPNPPAARANARKRHNVVGVRAHAGLIPDMPNSAVKPLRQALGLEPKVFRSAQEVIDHFAGN